MTAAANSAPSRQRPFKNFIRPPRLKSPTRKGKSYSWYRGELVGPYPGVERVGAQPSLSGAYGDEDLRIPGMRKDRLDVGEAHPHVPNAIARSS